mmetsp:Transcript_30544/g.46864  ORF Transcript_30544/g.46864 Transcript_30544/m.46864 type:complete len:339 (-) Transcript_30544:146-1162(-)|eukprot:CAMPEP_0195301854 /NCGR_PEP_ID=MMETSP0707-20130614/30060_1 /TAXON_ID=33640 /ORGANISM="Asterionellopsis glacialis, Strain CCMP134" /LENGTH=338 /DNA_ID=CAMNT_0040364939 /DNA_START=155 /DNA_END=1171 /DNA_ORIENTATION=-
MSNRFSYNDYDPYGRSRSSPYVKIAKKICLIGLEQTKKPINLLGIFCFIVIVASTEIYANGTKLFQYLFPEEEEVYNGRYPNSLLTLFYPYTLLRDVVLDQPVDQENDVPFFWHLHTSDEIIGKRILTDCYGLELVELNTLESIEKAKEVNLAARKSKNFVVTSPLIREAITIFTPEHFGRMFSFFRHPLDYDLHENLPTFPAKDNWLTRYLSDVHEGPIEFKQLGVAKHVVRETTVVGTADKMAKSMFRMGKYFGWKFKQGSDEEGMTCIEEAVNADNIKEKWIHDHTSEEWHQFYKMNKYDCQLYEIAQSAWRAQIQTVIPFETQMSRVDPPDEEE